MHWAAFTTSSGDGLLLDYSCLDPAPAADVPWDAAPGQRPADTKGMQLSASRYSMEELENTSHRHKLNQERSIGGEKRGLRQDLSGRPVHVHLDTAHLGVGGVGEGGSKLWATATQFMVNPACGPWSFTLRMAPVDSETWLYR